MYLSLYHVLFATLNICDIHCQKKKNEGSCLVFLKLIVNYLGSWVGTVHRCNPGRMYHRLQFSVLALSS
jgi:hypothetical protein